MSSGSEVAVIGVGHLRRERANDPSITSARKISAIKQSGVNDAECASWFIDINQKLDIHASGIAIELWSGHVTLSARNYQLVGNAGRHARRLNSPAVEQLCQRNSQSASDVP